jgi:hypothetical protein
VSGGSIAPARTPACATTRSEAKGGASWRQIKRMKLMDLEFANEVLTAEGEAVDASAPKRWRAEANAEKAERFRKGR